MLAEESDERRLYEGASALLAAHVKADGCLIYRVEADELVVMGGRGEQLRMPVGFGVTGRVAADVVVATLVEDSPRNPLHRRLLGLAEGQTVSRLLVPARLPDGTCVAVVAVHQRGHRVYDAAEVQAAQHAADLLALRVGLDRSRADAATYRAEWDGLVAATVAAQEAERRRVAGDLHDGVSQVIASLRFHLSAAELAVADGDLDYAREQVRAARELADLAVGEARSAITGLHTPVLDDLGLAAALASMARAVPNLPIEVAVEDGADQALPEAVAICVFRIAQEAVQNVVKHARASGASIELGRRGGRLLLTVTDDGDGFDTSASDAAGRYGLSGMAERARLIGGEFRVRTRPGAGTTVEVGVPLR